MYVHVHIRVHLLNNHNKLGDDKHSYKGPQQCINIYVHVNKCYPNIMSKQGKTFVNVLYGIMAL